MSPIFSSSVPVPDAVAVLIASAIPLRVLAAEQAAESAARQIAACRSPLSATREQALSAVAHAHKIIAAFDPRLMATGGAA